MAKSVIGQKWYAYVLVSHSPSRTKMASLSIFNWSCALYTSNAADLHVILYSEDVSLAKLPNSGLALIHYANYKQWNCYDGQAMAGSLFMFFPHWIMVI